MIISYLLPYCIVNAIWMKWPENSGVYSTDIFNRPIKSKIQSKPKAIKPIKIKNETFKLIKKGKETYSKTTCACKSKYIQKEEEENSKEKICCAQISDATKEAI